MTCVQSRDGLDARTVTPLELRMLLAAWLSPLEPPKPGLFRQMTGPEDVSS